MLFLKVIASSLLPSFQNLDVNLAVNNLLSRDEEDGDDQDEGESYIPGGKLSHLFGRSCVCLGCVLCSSTIAFVSSFGRVQFPLFAIFEYSLVHACE